MLFSIWGTFPCYLLPCLNAQRSSCLSNTSPICCVIWWVKLATLGICQQWSMGVVTTYGEKNDSRMRNQSSSSVCCKNEHSISAKSYINATITPKYPELIWECLIRRTLRMAQKNLHIMMLPLQTEPVLLTHSARRTNAALIPVPRCYASFKHLRSTVPFPFAWQRHTSLSTPPQRSQKFFISCPSSSIRNSQPC